MIRHPDPAHSGPTPRPPAGPRAAAGSAPKRTSAWLREPEDPSVAEVAALCWLDPDFEPEPGDPDNGDLDGRESGSLSAEVAPSCGGPLSHAERYDEIVVVPGGGPVESWEALPGAQRRELLGDDGDPEDWCAEDPAGDDGEGRFADVLGAGFTHRDPEPGATGWRAGGPLDVMLPGAQLAWHLGSARRRGLDQLSDDELIGFLAAARRVQSWQAGLELAATAELDARRAAARNPTSSSSDS